MKGKLARLSILLLLAFSLTACGAVSGLSSAKHTADTFMRALKDQDTDASWNLLTPDLQAEFGDQAAWVDFASIRNFESWKFTSTNVSGDTAEVDGEASIGKETYTISLVMDVNGSGWLISGINIKLKE
jgi:hypothetical protein